MTVASKPRLQRLSVVVPVYFNEASLAPLHLELLALAARLAEKSIALEVIFVDDGSGDGSLAELYKIREAHPETVVVKLTRNFGAAVASKIGMKEATGDALVLIAADLQDPVDLIDGMVDRFLAGGNFVICVRQTRDDPFPSKLLSSLYYRIVRAIVIADYPVGGFDMMLLAAPLYRNVAASGPNTNLQLFAYWLGFAPSILPYDRPARQFGRSKWTFGKRLKLLTDTLTGFSVVPIRAISAFGLLVACASFIYGIVILTGAVVRGSPVPGFPTLVMLNAFFGGLILVMLGVIGEYVWRIFDNTGQKPEGVVESIHRQSDP